MPSQGMPPPIERAAATAPRPRRSGQTKPTPQSDQADAPVRRRRSSQTKRTPLDRSDSVQEWRSDVLVAVS